MQEPYDSVQFCLFFRDETLNKFVVQSIIPRDYILSLIFFLVFGDVLHAALGASRGMLHGYLSSNTTTTLVYTTSTNSRTDS